MKHKYKTSLLGAILWLSSCSSNSGNLNNPQNTTDVLPYPPPVIENLQVSSDSIVANVTSYIRETGDFLGYIIYLTADEDIFGSIAGDSFNNPAYLEITNRPGVYGFLRRQDRQEINTPRIRSSSISFNQDGFQELSVDIQIASEFRDRMLYFGITAYGQNNFFARVHQHRGYIESLLDENLSTRSFFIRRTLSFFLTNFQSGASVEKGFRHQGDDLLEVGDTSADVVLRGAGLGSSILVPRSPAGIQGLGYSGDFSQITDIPEDGYSSERYPVIAGHVYAVKSKNGMNFYKIYISQVEQVEATPDTEDHILIQGEVAYLPASIMFRRF